ncbi:uncharacterized protein [Diabrotica undecimpunctata]|uniref:uncharacterized protein n=1 Tax=Diabrotica undecimpunctata TaxID=50387 RepID=UPI003B63D755
MTLNHSKTWPVSTMAVVQLRVSPQGGQYEIIESERYEEDKPTESLKEEDIKINDDGLVVPLLEKHLELFTKMASVPNLKTTIRTDTVSTILDPTDFDSERNEVCEEPPLKSPTSCEESVQKFHVLALARIEETGVGVNADDDCGGVDDNLRRGGIHVLGRRPSIKVDNWDFIYTERGLETQIRCPVHHYALSSPNGRLGSSGIKDSLLPPELPLDARKTTTLRRHYYPEGGWGWVIATCAVLVHVLNHGVQLAYSQLVSPGTEKFRVEKVHFADMSCRSKLLVDLALKNKQKSLEIKDCRQPSPLLVTIPSLEMVPHSTPGVISHDYRSHNYPNTSQRMKEYELVPCSEENGFHLKPVSKPTEDVFSHS